MPLVENENRGIENGKLMWEILEMSSRNMVGGGGGLLPLFRGGGPIRDIDVMGPNELIGSSLTLPLKFKHKCQA